MNEKIKLESERVINNNIIAQYMGYQLDIGKNEIGLLTYRKKVEGFEDVYQHVTKLEYDKHWNLLMPVVEKIMRECENSGEKHIAYGKEYIYNAHFRTFGMLNEENGNLMVRFDGCSVFEADTLIKATHKAVVDFIKRQSEDEKLENNE